MHLTASRILNSPKLSPNSRCPEHSESGWLVGCLPGRSDSPQRVDGDGILRSLLGFVACEFFKMRDHCASYGAEGGEQGTECQQNGWNTAKKCTRDSIRLKE